MKPTTYVRGAAALAVLATVLFAATPAHADGRELPEGDALYAISCDNSVPDGQLYSVEAPLAAIREIGTGSGVADAWCGAQPAWDATTSTAYYVSFIVENDPLLTIMDLETGVGTVVGAFNDGENDQSIDSIAIRPDGSAYAISGQSFYTLDLATGDVGYVGEVNAGPASFYGFAADPRTGTLYAIDYDGRLYTVDPATGAGTLLLTLAYENNGPYSLQVDTAGVLWIEFDFFDEVEQEGGAALWSVDTAALETSELYSGDFATTVGGNPVYTEALLLVPSAVEPEPALAATGLASAELGVFALAGVALLGAGALLAVKRRRFAA